MITIWHVQQKALARRISQKNSHAAPQSRVASDRRAQLSEKKPRVALWRHPRFTYRFNNRGSLYAAVFEWLIRCLQPSDRRTMLLEVISQPLLCSYPLFRLFVLAPWQPFNVSPPFPSIPRTLHSRKYIVQSYNRQSARQSPSSRSVSITALLRENEFPMFLT